jgi:hypothetical protein
MISPALIIDKKRGRTYNGYSCDNMGKGEVL